MVRPVLTNHMIVEKVSFYMLPEEQMATFEGHFSQNFLFLAQVWTRADEISIAAVQDDRNGSKGLHGGVD